MMSAVVTVEAGLMAAVERARDLAMDRAARAPIPWCGDFAGIAQDLDAALRAAAPKGEPVEIGKGPCAINGLPDQSGQKEISPAPASAGVTVQQAAQVLLDLLHMRGNHHDGMSREDVVGLWNAAKDGTGFAAVTAFLQQITLSQPASGNAEGSA